ncbi:phosphoribosylpyrophosphate synthetase [Chryseobacterium sp. CP-77]|uniref:phosphoribosylpyrophosphate synthetase n=1 Tax=Chryseobacterium sp. CP-77 TaxID=3116594 RepID=UPI002ED4DD7F
MNTIQPAFDTLTEAVQWLNQKGYTEDFNLKNDCIRLNNFLDVSPEDFKIRYTFRFEGDTDQGDEEVVYGIASDKYSVKGILTSAYGIYADTVSTELIRKLSSN